MSDSSRVSTNREHRLIGMLLSVVVLALGLLYFPPTQDATYITLRYSEHLAEGHGMGAWNLDGERVEGYSSTLWMLFLAAADWLGMQGLTTAKVSGIFAHLMLVHLFLALAYGRGTSLDSAFEDLPAGRDVFALAAVLLSVNLPLAWYAAGGTETSSFICLSAFLFLAPGLEARGRLSARLLRPAVIGGAGLLVWLRPEGFVFALLIVLLHMWRSRACAREFALWRAALLMVLVSIVLLTVLRLWHYGEWLPNTYFTVSGGGSRQLLLGFEYVYRWLTSHVPVLLVVVVFGLQLFLRRRDAGLRGSVFGLFCLLFPLLHGVYILMVGGDDDTAFPLWRHMLHLLPFWSVSVAAGLCFIMPRLRWGRVLLLLILLAAMNGKYLMVRNAKFLRQTRAAAAEFPRLQNAAFNPYFLWLKSMSSAQTLIAGIMAGEMPYVVDARHIDMLGINDLHIARNGEFDPTGPVDDKTDMDYVLRRRPDFIEGYLSMAELTRCVPLEELLDYRTKMCTEMLEHPLFGSEYLLVLNAPYEHLDRVLFIRRAFWAGHPRRAEIDVCELTETCLSVR